MLFIGVLVAASLGGAHSHAHRPPARKAAVKAAVMPKLGPTYTIYDTPSVLAVAPAPTGDKFAVTFDDMSVRIYDAATHKKLKVFRGHPQPPQACAWSPNGKWIATGDESARVFVWNAATGARVAQFRTAQRGIENLSFNDSSTLLLSTAKDDTIDVYNIATKKRVLHVAGLGADLYGARFSPVADAFAAGILHSGVRIYQMNGKLARYFNGHGGQGAFDVDYNPTGTRIISAGRDQIADVWDVKTGKRLGSLVGHTDFIDHAAYAPNGIVAATSSYDRTVRLWNTVTMSQIAVLDQESEIGSPIKFTADGKYLISSNVSDKLQITPLNPPQAPAKVKKAPAKARKYRRTARRR